MTNREYVVTQLDNIIEALSNIKNSVLESEEDKTVIKSENGDVPIGKVFEFEGKEYVAKEVNEIEYDNIKKGIMKYICDICAFRESDNDICNQRCCSWINRSDQTEVYFVEKE
jgi:hypothetical protein